MEAHSRRDAGATLARRQHPPAHALPGTMDVAWLRWPYQRRSSRRRGEAPGGRRASNTIIDRSLRATKSCGCGTYDYNECAKAEAKDRAFLSHYKWSVTHAWRCGGAGSALRALRYSPTCADAATVANYMFMSISSNNANCLFYKELLKFGEVNYPERSWSVRGSSCENISSSRVYETLRDDCEVLSAFILIH
ncbi:unnamed protein product [Chrysodeixis includens]|uniref:Uncharacterized protein n=1 Tax=Chrysodeixis includens TaxID=689277 RepID=A0A9N8KQP4_CHRIL|nr:unnamed protein product [Chrysodeixis includens]